jgi:hypothetical protein
MLGTSNSFLSPEYVENIPKQCVTRVCDDIDELIESQLKLIDERVRWLRISYE